MKGSDLVPGTMIRDCGDWIGIVNKVDPAMAMIEIEWELFDGDECIDCDVAAYTFDQIDAASLQYEWEIVEAGPLNPMTLQDWVDQYEVSDAKGR